jgi:methenyltetrahydrofolate cyclohydrolase
MSSPLPFLELRVGELLDELAAAGPSPGGGSALAVATSIAAAVVTMAARVSESPALVAQADALRARAEPLAQVDADVYREALGVRAHARELSPERRDWEIGLAFARAAEPPLEIGRVAADVAELAAELARNGSPAIRADAIAAAALAAAAARGAVAMVEVNLTALPDDPRVDEARLIADTAAASAARATAE